MLFEQWRAAKRTVWCLRLQNLSRGCLRLFAASQVLAKSRCASVDSRINCASCRSKHVLGLSLDALSTPVASDSPVISQSVLIKTRRLVATTEVDRSARRDAASKQDVCSILCRHVVVALCLSKHTNVMTTQVQGM